MAEGHQNRPPVSVIVPFFGDASAARSSLASLADLQTRAGDEVLVVDNSPGRPLMSIPTGGRVTPVNSPVTASAYAARNLGAEGAANDWLLFVDADCHPSATLLDDFFAEPIDEDCGAIGGQIVGNPAQSRLAARYARARGLLSIEANRRTRHLPAAVTANLLARRDAWRSIGGFCEGMRAAAGDVDFAWRLQQAGWRLAYRDGAKVEHDHRDSLRALLRQVARNAAGDAWLNRRHPGALPRPKLLRGLVRSGGAVVFALRGQFDRAAFKLVDGAVVIAQNLGRMANNAALPSRDRAFSPAVVAVLGTFPESSDQSTITWLESLERSHGQVFVVAARRANLADWSAGRRFLAWFREDEGVARRGRSTIWLLVRHPARCLRSGHSDGTHGSNARFTLLSDIATSARMLSGRSGLEIHAIASSAGDAVLLRTLLGEGAAPGSRSVNPDA